MFKPKEAHVDGSLKLQLKEFLRVHPGNLSKAAKHLGVPREKVKALVAEFEYEFQEIEEEFLDDLAEQVIRFSTGKLDEGMTLKFNEALKLLAVKRPDEWGAKAKGPKKQKPNGYAAAQLKQYAASLIPQARYEREVKSALDEEDGTIRPEATDDEPL